MSKDWDDFIESLDGGGGDWVHSPDLTALSKLQGTERERALQLLSSRLTIGDPRTSRTLGVLADPRAKTALEAHLTAATGRDRVATANALLKQSPGQPAAVKAVKDGLANPDLGIANEALDAAPLVGKPIVDTLLATAVLHPIRDIRVGAIKNALFLTGVNPSPHSWDHRDEIVNLVMGDRDERRTAFASLCQRMNVDLNAYRGPRP